MPKSGDVHRLFRPNRVRSAGAADFGASKMASAFHVDSGAGIVAPHSGASPLIAEYIETGAIAAVFHALRVFSRAAVSLRDYGVFEIKDNRIGWQSAALSNARSLEPGYIEQNAGAGNFSLCRVSKNKCCVQVCI